MIKNLSILGATGSIGDSALKILENFKENLNLVAVSTNKNVKKLIQIIEKYSPEYAVITDKESCQKYFNSDKAIIKNTKIFSGIEYLLQLCSDKKNDIILNAVSGKSGLIPSLKCLENGIDLALANKESMVCAGPLMKKTARQNRCQILPVDSEHSAIFQLLRDKNSKEIDKIYLTASGGPFLNLDKSNWNKITVADALNHPTWKMGSKISIDSATMANKGLEVIETKEFFDIEYDRIKVLIHPQSLIHSMIEMRDGEIYAQIGPNDMSIPIQNSLFFPEILENRYNRFDFTKTVNFQLFPVDFSKYKMLSFAYISGKNGGLYPAFYNCVNERLVDYFLKETISFLDIEKYMERALDIFAEDRDVEKNDITIENVDIIENLSKRIVDKLIKG